MRHTCLDEVTLQMPWLVGSGVMEDMGHVMGIERVNSIGQQVEFLRNSPGCGCVQLIEEKLLLGVDCIEGRERSFPVSTRSLRPAQNSGVER